MSQDSPADRERDESDICEELRALVLGGHQVSEDVIDHLLQARHRQAAVLENLRADEAEERVAEKATAADADLQQIEDGRASGSGHLYEEILCLSPRLRWLYCLGDRLSGELSRDPLSFVEEDIDWVERSVHHLRRLDESLEEASSALEARVEEIRSMMLERKLLRFLDDTDVPGAANPLDEALNLWFASSESFGLETAFAARKAREREGALERGEPRVEGRREEAFVTRLAAQRGQFVARCAMALAQAGLKDRARFCQEVASDLIDRSGAMLTEAAVRSRERMASLRSLRHEIDRFFEVVGESQGALLKKGNLPPRVRRELRHRLLRLEKIRKQTRTAEREELVYRRLQRFFGPRIVRLSENLVFLMILAVLVLAGAEWWLASDAGGPAGGAATEAASAVARRRAWIRNIHLVDLVLCVFFQIDFFVRWGFAGWRGWYFRRHFFFESLPALPYGLLLPYLNSVIVVRLARFQRFLRLPILLRALRIFAFFVRGADRAVERFRGVLDRDVVFFDAKGQVAVPDSPLRSRLLELQGRSQKLARDLYEDLPWSDRPAVLRSQLAYLEVEARFFVRLGLPYRRDTATSTEEILLEDVIRRLVACDVARSIAYFGREGALRLARWLRFLDVPVFRRVPVVRRLVPAARLPDPAHAVSQAVRTAGELLEDFLGMVRFWGDVSGITTGPQILDRVGSAMVLASKRPAIRLLLLGGLFLILRGMAELLFEGGGFLSSASEGIYRLLGLPILILGSICLVVLGIGKWFKRIAGDALDAHLRTSDAHFYALIKDWKRQRCREDLRTLYRSVLAPERKLRLRAAAVRADDEEEWIRFLSAPMSFDPEDPGGSLPVARRWVPFVADRDAVFLYYRSFLDWPILHRDDDGTSVQLLGNLTLNDIRTRTLGMSRRELRKLEKLNLEKSSSLSLGPYFWFRFITESLAIETAKLVVEYNRSCLPLEAMAFATREQKERFRDFLAARQRAEQSAYQRRTARARVTTSAALVTDEFSSLNFLMADPVRDREVGRRFGDEVLAGLQRDRKGVIRDIFGTRPYHLLPRSQRVFNPYRLYRKYLGGARFVLLPLVLAAGGLRLLLAAVRQVASLVDEVRGGNRVLRSQMSRNASFGVAVRKINRMRKPHFMEALRLRASIDVEYLGLRIPGYEAEDVALTYRDDLDFIGAVERERRPLDRMQKSAAKDLRRFRSYLRQRGYDSGSFFLELDPTGDLDEHRGEVLRALVTAYMNDHLSLRSRITAPQVAREFTARALERRETWSSRLEHAVFGCLFWFLPANRRRRRLMTEYLSTESAPRRLSADLRGKLARAFLDADEETEQSVAMVVRSAGHENSGEDSVLRDLRRIARQYAAWTRKVIIVRTLQAVTVLDIRSYRDLVWKLGGYEAESGTEAPLTVVTKASAAQSKGTG